MNELRLQNQYIPIFFSISYCNPRRGSLSSLHKAKEQLQHRYNFLEVKNCSAGQPLQICAYPPSKFIPVKRASSQRFSRPLRQNLHFPQVCPNHGTPTRSPILNFSTPAPFANTLPTISWPKISGNFGLVNSPSNIWRSVRQTPQAQTLIKISFWPNEGTGKSTFWSKVPDVLKPLHT